MAPTKPKAVVLLSGGLDSTTCATLASIDYGSEQVFAISFAYGQKHSLELEAADAVAAQLDLGGHTILQLPREVFADAKSALVEENGVSMPHLSYEQIQQNQGPSPTYVPFRNANLLSQATAYALTIGAEAVYFGAHSEDAHNFAYPDCTPEFIGAMANAIYVGTYHSVRLVTPLQWLSKTEIVRLASDIGAPVELTLSCYEGTTPACGQCPTCVSRLMAFANNALIDPIEYIIPNDERADVLAKLAA